MNSFDYNNKPTPDMLTKMENLRGRFKILAAAIKCGLPVSRERALAITKLEEAAFWLNKAITHQPEVEHTTVIPAPTNDIVGEAVANLDGCNLTQKQADELKNAIQNRVRE